MSIKVIIGFAYSVLLVWGSFFFVGIAAAVVAGALKIWDEPFAGFVTALVWVVIGSATAPKAKLVSAFLWLLFGCVVAWFLIGTSYFPESHPRAYQSTYYPLVMTYIGGVVGFLIAAILVRRNVTKV